MSIGAVPATAFQTGFRARKRWQKPHGKHAFPRPGWLPRVNAARNAQTERDYHFDTGLADIARLRTTGQRAGSTFGAGLE
ncbi:hypothetical protein EOS_13110 [Caballeronia mineralivorans PML1(12)]|uniref:Uncharacterized protein n=1 Tax=Caballeronia mineralivorans PML1(12) TaxID=908627 RepID=A0A0J1CZ62_9BURK|nr:hypothetical protein EOS_13110 [Caballeronia mineralivorans PML1(12)]